MTCPHLEYRREDDSTSFDHERPYCAVQGEFVSPMKADICNDRFEFAHAADCDVYRRAAQSTEHGTEQPTDESTGHQTDQSTEKSTDRSTEAEVR